MHRFREKLKNAFTFRWRDAAVTLLIFSLASLISWMLQTFSSGDDHVPLIFVLAVLLVSLLTEGYLWGLLASVVAVLGANIVFTYPYFHMDFSMTGYPLTFMCMFAVSLITCTMTTRIPEMEKARMEGEREKMRANLLRAVSHDFRTPLTGMIGSINAVLENGDRISEADRKKLLGDAKSEAEWLVNMVENLLSITRIGGGAPDLHTEPQVVEEVLWEAVSRFRKQYPGFEVNIRIPSQLLLVEMDAMLIEQVVINLLLNAALHGGTATAAVLSVTREGDSAVFSVEDNGRGIAREKLNQLFDPAAMSSGVGGNDKGRGMGIGLSVCSTIIRAHGGHMWAENVPGSGAKVSFALPACGEETEKEEL